MIIEAQFEESNVIIDIIVDGPEQEIPADFSDQIVATLAGAVRYDKVQFLTEEERQRAINNLGINSGITYWATYNPSAGQYSTYNDILQVINSGRPVSLSYNNRTYNLISYDDELEFEVVDGNVVYKLFLDIYDQWNSSVEVLADKSYVDYRLDNLPLVEVFTTNTYNEVQSIVNSGHLPFIKYEGETYMFAGSSNYAYYESYAFYSINTTKTTVPYNQTIKILTIDFTDHWLMQSKVMQPELISGLNIKSINGQTILGSGDLNVHDVWWATYDPEGTSSSYDSIKIHQNRFQYICINYEDRIYMLNSSGSKLLFEAIDSDQNKIYCLRCDNQNNWSESSKSYYYDDTNIQQRLAILEQLKILVEAHMADTTIHTNSEEKNFWNNKVNTNYLQNYEQLIFTRSNE